MSMSEPPIASQSPSLARAHTLPMQRLLNRLIRGLLRTPLVCRLAGKRLITVYFTGRKSGRHYAIPVAYTQHNGTLLVGSQFAWMRNLRTGEMVDVRLMGKRRSADVQVLAEENSVVHHFALMARDNHQFANFNSIGFDERGDPRREDLHLAWAAGGRGAVLTPK